MSPSILLCFPTVYTNCDLKCKMASASSMMSLHLSTSKFTIFPIAFVKDTWLVPASSQYFKNRDLMYSGLVTITAFCPMALCITWNNDAHRCVSLISQIRCYNRCNHCCFPFSHVQLHQRVFAKIWAYHFSCHFCLHWSDGNVVFDLKNNPAWKLSCIPNLLFLCMDHFFFKFRVVIVCKCTLHSAQFQNKRINKRHG